MNIIFFNKVLVTLIITVASITTNVISAEKITFISGAYSRSLTLNELDLFAKTGKAKGFLNEIIKYSKEDKKVIKSLLNQEIELPLLVTSRLMNSRIGEAMIKRIAKVIHPFKITNEKTTVPAIRSAVIKGLYNGKGSINLLAFFKAYPNKVMAINVPALIKAIEKAESISDLVTFFSNSPLDNLKTGATKS